MYFEWDAQKAAKVLRERGIDFNDLIPLFTEDRIEISSNKIGEIRWVTVGAVNGKVMAVVYTKRGDVIRIITARRARKNEERAYHSHDPRRGDEPAWQI